MYTMHFPHFFHGTFAYSVTLALEQQKKMKPRALLLWSLLLYGTYAAITRETHSKVSFYKN